MNTTDVIASVAPASSRRSAVLAALALTVIALAGCGGSSSSSSKTTTTSKTTSSAPTTTTKAPSSLTKAEYIKKADAICEEGATFIGDALDEALAAADALEMNNTHDARLDLAETMDVFAAQLSATTRELRALAPPAEDPATVSKYLDALDSTIKSLEGFSSAVESNDVSRARELHDEGVSTSNTAKDLARGYGFKVCGSG